MVYLRTAWFIALLVLFEDMFTRFAALEIRELVTIKLSISSTYIDTYIHTEAGNIFKYFARDVRCRRLLTYRYSVSFHVLLLYI